MYYKIKIMKIGLLLVMLLSFASFGQDSIQILKRSYLDKKTFTYSDYTTCDSMQTIRVVYDNEISNAISSRLSELYNKNYTYEDILDGNAYFIKQAAIDSNKNVMAINILSNGIDSFVEYAICGIETDSEIMVELIDPTTKIFYVNYFQVLSLNNRQTEFIEITVRRRFTIERYLLFKHKEQ